MDRPTTEGRRQFHYGLKKALTMPENKAKQLTPRQQEILGLITDRIVNRGYGPTVREIGNLTGIRSPNGVMCHLKALEKKGHIRRTAHAARGIELVDSPVDRLRSRAKSLLAAWKRGDLVAKNQSSKEKLSGIFSELRSLV